MKYKVITVKKLKENAPSGAFGTYYKISSKVGVKTVYDREFSSLNEVKQSWEIKAASRELKALKKVYSKSKMTPKGYDVVILKTPIKNSRRSIYRVGYSMQHITGSTIEKSKYKHAYSLWEEAKDIFKSKGFYQTDGHSANAMITKVKSKKPKVIFIDAGGIAEVGKDYHDCAWRR